MTERSLQVTYRKGRPFAAYLHLSHATGEKSARTVAAPHAVSLERINDLLASLDQPPLADHEFKPVRAA